MKGTQWYRAGLFNAMKPWTGNYGSQRRDGSFTVGPMVWAAAHTTQFSKPGWSYLPVGQGSGMLTAGAATSVSPTLLGEVAGRLPL